MEFDPVKMLVGDDFSWGFIVEIVVRTTIMYLYTLGIVRVIGKRGLAPLPVRVSDHRRVGSSWGPDVLEDIPIIHGITVITVVVFLQRMLQEVTEKSPKLEQILRASRASSSPTVSSTRCAGKETFPNKRSSPPCEIERSKTWTGQAGFLEPSGEISVFKTEEKASKPAVGPSRRVIPLVAPLY